jgi:hypothetical protein
VRRGDRLREFLPRPEDPGEGVPPRGGGQQAVRRPVRGEVPGADRVVYLVVRSGWFDVLGFLLGLSSLFLGVLLEALWKSFQPAE